MAEISLESYSTKPTFDITYNDTELNMNVSSMGKIPVKLMLVSLALDFDGLTSKK